MGQKQPHKPVVLAMNFIITTLNRQPHLKFFQTSLITIRFMQRRILWEYPASPPFSFVAFRPFYFDIAAPRTANRNSVIRWRRKKKRRDIRQNGEKLTNKN